MQKRALGKTGLEVSALDFGCMGISQSYGRRENLGAVRVQLTDEDLQEIDRAASQIEVHGARYPEQLLKMVNR